MQNGPGRWSEKSHSGDSRAFGFGQAGDYSFLYLGLIGQRLHNRFSLVTWAVLSGFSWTFLPEAVYQPWVFLR